MGLDPKIPPKTPPQWKPPDQPWYPGIDVFDTRTGPAAAVKKKVAAPSYLGGELDAFFGRGKYASDPYSPGTQQAVASLLGSITGGLPSQVNPTSTDQIIQSMLQNSPTASGGNILPSLSSSSGGTSLQDYLNSLGSLSGLLGGATTGGTTDASGSTLTLADLLGGFVGGDKGLAPATPDLPNFTAPGAGQGGSAGYVPGSSPSILSGLINAVSAGRYGPAGSAGAGVPGVSGVGATGTGERADYLYTDPRQQEQRTTTEQDNTGQEDPYAAYRQFLPPASDYVPEGGGMFFDESTYQPFDIATDPAFQARYAAPEVTPEQIATTKQQLVQSGQMTQEQADSISPDSKFWPEIISGGLSLIGGLIGSQGASDAANAEMRLLREMREQNLAGGQYAGDLGAQAASLAANELIGSQGLAGETMSGAYLQTGDIQADAAQRAADTLANAILSGGQYKTDAAGNLYNAAVGTGQAGVNIQEQKLQQALKGLSPYTGAGETAVGQQLAETLAGPGDYKLSDEYQFMLDQGLKEASAQLSAQGLGQSGRHVRAATELAENVASQAEQQQFNNWLARQGALGNLSGMGLSGATTGGTLGVSTGAGQADTLLAAQELAQKAGLYGAEAGGTALTQAGAAQSSGIQNIANAISTGIMGSSGSLADMYIGQGQSAAGGYTGAADARTEALLRALGLNVPAGQQQALAAGDRYINQANAWTNTASNLSDLIWLLSGGVGGNSGLSMGF